MDHLRTQNFVNFVNLGFSDRRWRVAVKRLSIRTQSYDESHAASSFSSSGYAAFNPISGAFANEFYYFSFSWFSHGGLPCQEWAQLPNAVSSLTLGSDLE